MEFNFKNSRNSLSFFFENKIYKSIGYEFTKFKDHNELSDSELFDFLCISGNLGIVLRLFDSKFLTPKKDFIDAPYSDIIIFVRNSNNLSNLNIDSDGIKVTMNGYFNVDINQDDLINIYEDFVAYEIGFWAGNHAGFMFSPIDGYDKNDSSTWKRFTGGKHNIKIYHFLENTFSTLLVNE